MRPLITIFFIIFAVSVLFSGTIIGNFRGQPGFNKVTLKWTSEGEQNLKGFEIERSFENKEGTFLGVGSVSASQEIKQKKEYEYEDKTVFKGGARTFYYRLKIVDTDGGATYTKPPISVSPTISNARQTWGSIKAMFR